MTRKTLLMLTAVACSAPLALSSAFAAEGDNIADELNAQQLAQFRQDFGGALPATTVDGMVSPSAALTEPGLNADEPGVVDATLPVTADAPEATVDSEVEATGEGDIETNDAMDAADDAAGVVDKAADDAADAVDDAADDAADAVDDAEDATVDSELDPSGEGDIDPLQSIDATDDADGIVDPLGDDASDRINDATQESDDSIDDPLN